MKVGDFMTTRIHTVSSGRSVRTVADRMEQLKTGCLLVEENGEILGILTSRDVRSSHPNRIAADVMTSRIISVTTEDFIWDALNLMKNHHIERLVVTEGEQVRGIVTRESLSAALNRFIDPLTGLYRAEYIRHLTDHFLNLKKTFQFLFLDLDNFGEINKQFGHPVGDDFICRFAERLTAISGMESTLYAGMRGTNLFS